MAIGDRTWQWAAHTSWGYPFNHLHNVIEHTFAYTATQKKVSVGSAGAVHSAIATVVAGVTVTTGFTQPDVPRILAVTTGGTTADFAASTLTIVGVNVEGKTITDVLAISDNQAGQTVGSLVFKRITSVALNKADGTGGTFTIDTTNKLGLNHRLPANFSTIVVIQDTQNDILTNNSVPTVQAAPSSSNADGEFVEKNWVQPATAPDGTTFLYFFYWFHKVLVAPPKDSPEFYSTTTSTSTSTSSTSTSSTSLSTSTSVSSTSVSTTSTSTSSTSTSTTTLPV